MTTTRKIIRRLALCSLILLISYIGIVVFLYHFQRHLVFKPSGELQAPAHYGAKNFELVTLTTRDTIKLRAWYRPAPSPNAPVLVYFHGNAGNIGSRAKKLTLLAEHMGVLALSYRGYGGNGGEPSEQGLYEDARTALRFLDQFKISNNRVILYGESLGTGVAVQMATEYKPAALVLEAPYTSLPVLGAIEYPYIPVQYLMKDKFDSLAKIAQVKVPLLIFHGEKDTVVPPDHARQLFLAAHTTGQVMLFTTVHHSDFDTKTIAKLTYQFARAAMKGE